ncbi:MAG: ABC transporter permease [Bacteroidota bacterium]
MILFLKLFRESYLMALQAIVVNKLRTILTLSGITIGIFAIISVFTIVDSLEIKIRESIATLGDDVIFVEKWPWSFGSDYPWWKYLNRPETKMSELQEIQKRSSLLEAATFRVQLNKLIKFEDNSIENTQILGVSEDYDRVMSVDVAQGRFFSHSEALAGKNYIVIGNEISRNLFNNSDPLGKEVTVFGKKLEVIGVLKKQGDDAFGPSADMQAFIPFGFFSNQVDVDEIGSTIAVKARKGVSNEELIDELTGIMRSVRKLKPAAEDNFAINQTSLLTKGFDGLFKIISLAGWIIGGFSLLVGGFGIANIMFVSVKERTHIIGIQKSLGAKNYFILLQFLFESIFLSLIGGVFGLLIIYLGTLLISAAFDMNLTLTMGNIMLGITVSFLIGLVSGFIPAWMASRLSPVEAIRSSN